MAALNDMLVYLRKRSGLSQQELADKLEMTRSAIGMYETGRREPDLETLEIFADFYNVDMNTLTGRGTAPIHSPNLIPLEPMQQIPLLGQIACGEPILAEQNIEEYIDLPKHIRADFALLCKGDSMINAGIQEGDVVYIRQQGQVENGQIAAVMVGNEEATLKRVYFDGEVLQLVPENPKFTPKVFIGEDINSSVRIIGLAVAYTRVIE